MSHRCHHCQKPFIRTYNRNRHERYTCWKRFENEEDRAPLVASSPEKGKPSGIELGEAFRFKTPSSILIMGPLGCGKTCFTHPKLFITATVRGKMDSETCKMIQFHEGIPTLENLQKWFPQGGVLVLDDLMVETGREI